MQVRAFACLVLLALSARPALAQKKDYNKDKEKEPNRQVVKYVAHKEKVPYHGTLVLVLGVEPVQGGRPTELMVKNHDMNKREYNPVVNTDNINALHKGDAIKIEFDDSKPAPFVTYVKKYDLKPGEENPKTYVFEITMEKGEGRQAYNAVVLSKFDQMTTCAIPQKKGKEGQPEPDPEMMAMVSKLNRGDLVEAEMRESRPVPTLVHIDRYAPPQTGKFVKLGEEEVDGQKTPAVELEREGKTVKALVAGKLVSKKWVPDAKVMAAARKLKPDAEVVYRAREDGGKVWLKEIEPAPKPQEGRDARDRDRGAGRNVAKNDTDRSSDGADADTGARRGRRPRTEK
jgi:hypothetical protein